MGCVVGKEGGVQVPGEGVPLIKNVTRDMARDGVDYFGRRTMHEANKRAPLRQIDKTRLCIAEAIAYFNSEANHTKVICRRRR